MHTSICVTTYTYIYIYTWPASTYIGMCDRSVCRATGSDDQHPNLQT